MPSLTPRIDPIDGYLLDTCVIRLWYAKNPAVEAKVSALPGDALLYVSAITIGEIEFGHTNVASEPQRQAAFRLWIDSTFEIPELPVTGHTGRIYAEFRRMLFDRFTRVGKYSENREDKLGTKVGVDENDLWLVAQARERTLTFVTIDKMSRINEVVGSKVTIEKWPDK